ncbi:MAG: putative toxin-antitoxin system toxin component, PIN family [Bacteroidota bacterium]|nr:putative toxin-antitoxin system toxin component, PIN family [Bacteroidota bacterium]
MQKIIIDTNVLVSSLIQRNYPYFILYHYVLENLVEVCISDDLFKEYLDVLHRPKFSKYHDFSNNAESVLAQIEEKATMFYPTIRIDEIRDNADNRLLELAIESKADFIITGNTNDFTMTVFKGTKIVTPKEYWDNYRE